MYMVRLEFWMKEVLTHKGVAAVMPCVTWSCHSLEVRHCMLGLKLLFSLIT